MRGRSWSPRPGGSPAIGPNEGNDGGRLRLGFKKKLDGDQRTGDATVPDRASVSDAILWFFVALSRCLVISVIIRGSWLDVEKSTTDGSHHGYFQAGGNEQ